MLIFFGLQVFGHYVSFETQNGEDNYRLFHYYCMGGELADIDSAPNIRYYRCLGRIWTNSLLPSLAWWLFFRKLSGIRVRNRRNIFINSQRNNDSESTETETDIFCVSHRYNVLFTALTYFLPICAMSFAYVQVGRDLWGSQGIGECTDFQLENIKSKRKVFGKIFHKWDA